MSKETGGSAFPDFKQNGMTLRDYFAAKAMQGICADPSFNLPTADAIAALAFEVADAMLAERAA